MKTGAAARVKDPVPPAPTRATLTVSGTHAPAPSQNRFAPHAAPTGSCADPQVFDVHVRAVQALSIPGQLAATTHWTQWPLPSHTFPPPLRHGVAAGAAVPLQTEPLHVS